MTTTSKKQSNVTLLHQGQGPSLFRLDSRPLNESAERKVVRVAAANAPSVQKSLGRLNPRHSPAAVQPQKRIVVKCMDRQDANSMLAKRIQARATRHYRPPSGMSTSNKGFKTLVQQQQCELYLKERLFTNSPHKPAPFPPPSFMPFWNPRHKDRTYLSKMVLDDPWSLPPEKRAELKNRTGLRLKSISRHYQYKVGANLPFGKDAIHGCTCFVEFCDHCSKPHHDYRCPLHMQALDAFEPDCKTKLEEFCPFSKNAEDLQLAQIQDAGVYVSEVVRRLRAGEIREVPPFPSQFLLKDEKRWNISKLKNASASASADALDPQDKKAVVEDSCTQTEPFIVDVDMKAAYKENMCQTRKPEKEEPMMHNSVLKSLANQSHYKSFPVSKEMSTQVTPCKIQTFWSRSEHVVKNLAKETVQQSLQEISNEMRLQIIEKYRTEYMQQLLDLQRTAQFKFLQEKWRNNAFADEQFQIQRELVQERSGETAVCAVGFAMSFFWNFPGKVMNTLRREGFIVNEDLKAMNSVVSDEMNRLMEEKLMKRDKSIKLLDEMIQHALLDLEMDAFRSRLVDEKYLNPLNRTTRFLRDIVLLRDNNIEIIMEIRERMLATGWFINETGEFVEGKSSLFNLDHLLKGVRVSVDPEGEPQQTLVDIKGKPIPFNVKWTEVPENQLEQHGSDNQGRRYDILLDGKSFSDIKKRRSTKHGEGEGLDLDYLGTDVEDDDDDDDPGRLVFKRKTQYEDDYDEVNM